MSFLPRRSSLSRADQALTVTAWLSAALAGAIILAVGGYLIVESSPVLAEVPLQRFFTDPAWRPSDGLYLLSPMILGTVVTTAGAVAVATPLGVASALFSAFY